MCLFFFTLKFMLSLFLRDPMTKKLIAINIFNDNIQLCRMTDTKIIQRNQIKFNFIVIF